MTTDIVPSTGLAAFVAVLREYGADPETESGLVLYSVVPVSGALTGKIVRTGVTVDEVMPWPSAPPHWIHLPANVTFSTTNTSGSPKPGWLSHSRDIQGWGTAAAVGAAWLAHVRGVLGGAV